MYKDVETRNDGCFCKSSNLELSRSERRFEDTNRIGFRFQPDGSGNPSAPLEDSSYGLEKQLSTKSKDLSKFRL